MDREKIEEAIAGALMLIDDAAGSEAATTFAANHRNDPHVGCGVAGDWMRVTCPRCVADAYLENASKVLDAALSAGLCGEREADCVLLPRECTHEIAQAFDAAYFGAEEGSGHSIAFEQAYDAVVAILPSSPDREAAIRREALMEVVTSLRAQLPEGGARPPLDQIDRTADATRRMVIADILALLPAPPVEGGASDA